MDSPIIAIIPAKNEAKSIVNVLHQLERARIDGAIVVCNGCTDETSSLALSLQSQLPYDLHIVWIESALGHDVARAVGTYSALRQHPGDGLFLYIDGDWQGAFGPMLGDFLLAGRELNCDVLSVTWSSLGSSSLVGVTAMPWRAALKMQQVVPETAAPFLLPMLVRTRMFQHGSPMLIAHPGHFFAFAAMRGCLWMTFEDWHMELVGNPSRSRLHHAAISNRIAQDGQVACDVLGGRPVKRLGPLANLPDRDIRTLTRYAAEASWQIEA
ncbi:glycosyltransferase family A protein [Alicyclobacillus dauci]|uniref:Glycosyltransferase family 2 protein n=1 Tax=Alicyclobacillus dauci TaxID=1475485 RepID=A0ABY6Z4V6_9BACL|nr:glycosyltransferase family A protein [Alicyclobacillus dauci]WAH37319.1 glycosyltransferase family 2 protein [Alicyclobacillus dauci]